MELDARKERVLGAIVETYIHTGQPVGSKWVAQQLGGQVSPATIRNDMAALFDMGLIEQPHTSSGRIPSHLGYRVYIDRLMPQTPLSQEEKARINAIFNVLNPDPDRLLEDAAKVLHITDVPYGTRPEVGAYCSDANVNNALAIVDGMTTELAGQVKKVAATETESTTLTLESGVEIVFGTAENIRDKERVCLEIMKEHPDGLAYINVRVVDRPTWRAL